MNRIKISPLAMASNQEIRTLGPIASQRGKVGRQDNADGQSSTVLRRSQDPSVFVPMHYERNYAYPLIVWLHADQQNASEVHEIMPRVSMRNYVAVAPTIASTDEAWTQDNPSIYAAHDAVVGAVAEARSRFNINPQRIFLAGGGAGATMAFRVALERPELFAGVLAINGPLPVTGTPLCRWDHSRKLPVFWAHCRKSTHFQQQQLCEQLRLLHIAGFSLTLRQYPGDDQISDALLGDVNRWVMENVNSKPGSKPPRAK